MTRRHDLDNAPAPDDKHDKHDERCESEFILEAGAHTPCGCADRRSALLGQIRTALVYRMSVTKMLFDRFEVALDDSDRVVYAALRARRAAYWEAVKLIDEVVSTGQLRGAEVGGPDGLLDVMSVEP